jgi:anaerobic magnesium-protoporphyrin IX monomethyl ester cyclase
MLYLISPPLKVQKHDTFTTGIIYMPIGLATISSYFAEIGIQHKVIDCFGSEPTKPTHGPHFWSFGINPGILVRQLTDCKTVVIYANQAANHESVIEIIQEIRNAFASATILVLENTQAVTAYSLKPLKEVFINAGADQIITGYYEDQIAQILRIMNRETLVSAVPKIVPIPNWKDFPIQNYWSNKLSHGPFSTESYLPILTSRGCPFNCSFCVVPATNNRDWIGRPPEEVFTEIKFLVEEFKVREFHLEDLNPTIDIMRIQKIAELITPLGVIWKIVAGTKAETIKNEEILKKLAASGLKYLSISPESGSAKTKFEIGKRFDNDHAINLIKWCRESDVKTQACFVLGMPGEGRSDRKATARLIRKFTIQGIDEIAIFIIAPIPGSQVFKNTKNVSLTDVSFSPTWRDDYKRLSISRLAWYLQFLMLKLIFHPISFAQTVVRHFRRQFELKMELAPFRSYLWKKWSRNETEIF